MHAKSAKIERDPVGILPCPPFIKNNDNTNQSHLNAIEKEMNNINMMDLFDYHGHSGGNYSSFEGNNKGFNSF